MFKNKFSFYISLTLLNAVVMAAIYLPSVVSLQPRPVFAEQESATEDVANKLVNQPPVTVPQKVSSGKPVNVTVPSLAIDLAVFDGNYDKSSEQWTLGYESAFYATPTVIANDQRGSTLVYAHNLEGLFASLHRIKPGATLLVTTDNGLIFRYSFQSSQEVAPGAVQSIRNDGPPTMILQTCTGNWSERRVLFSFQLVSVDEA